MDRFSNSSSDSITSHELGEYLFGLCLRHVASFTELLTHPNQQTKNRIDTEKIDEVELLIAFMWSYFDFLQARKYGKALTTMHSCFMHQMGQFELKEDEVWHLLQARYDDYRKSHRSQDDIDFTYQKVSHEICKNILQLDVPNTDIFLWTSVTITLQEQILNIGKAIKNKTIKDIED